MFSFKKRQLEDVIQLARDNERHETEKRLRMDFERKESELVGKHKLEVAKLKSDILKLQTTIDGNHKHVLDADSKKSESINELREAKLIMTALSDMANNFINSQAELLRPFLKMKGESEYKKKLLDIEVKNEEV